MSFGLDRRRKKTQDTEVDTEGTWAISYGDMITLLLAFFVLFFTVDPQKEDQNQLQQALVIKLQKASKEEKNSSKAQKSQQNKDTNRKLATINVGKKYEANISPNIIQKWGGKVYKIGHRIVIDFPGVSFFQLGYININDEGTQQLEKFVKIYMPYAGNYILGIRAFTDSRKVKYKRRFKDNLELSALRSIAAMRTLRQLGIPLERMRLGGYGELRITRDQLVKMATEKGLKDIESFSRKIVLVIEPEEKVEEPS